MKQYFLPVGLIAALVCALIMPAAGIFLSGHYGIQLLIFTIFLVSGYQTSTRGLQWNRKLLFLCATAAVISLIAGPLLGVTLAKIAHLTPALSAGLIIIATMPPTISSGIVITGISKGNTLLALFLTIGLNLLAVVTIPFTLSLCLQTAGEITVDRTALLITMAVLVLLPFALGKILRSVRKKQQVSGRWSYVSSLCVILVVYGSLATSAKALSKLQMPDLLYISMLVAALHLILFGMAVFSGKLLGLSIADNKALSFVTSQKTLAMALAVITSINIDTGNAILVCLIFHFLQLFTDSFLAQWWQSTTV